MRFLTVYSIPMQFDTLVIMVLVLIHIAAYAFKIAVRFAAGNEKLVLVMTLIAHHYKTAARFVARNEKLILWIMLFSVSLGWMVTWWVMSVVCISDVRALECKNMRVRKALDEVYSQCLFQHSEFQACKNYLNECADSSTDVSAPMWMGKFN